MAEQRGKIIEIKDLCWLMVAFCFFFGGFRMGGLQRALAPPPTVKAQPVTVADPWYDNMLKLQEKNRVDLRSIMARNKKIVDDAKRESKVERDFDRALLRLKETTRAIKEGE